MDHNKLVADARQRIFARLDLLAQPTPEVAAEEPTGPLAWLDAHPTICDFCRKPVAYRNTKVERENLDYGGQPVFYGQTTSLEVRVCSHH